MRQCHGVGGWVRLKYSCVDVGTKSAGANQQSDEGSESSSSFILYGPLAFLNPFVLLTPLRLPYPLCSFPPTMLCPDLRFPQNCRPPRTPACEVGCTCEIAPDAHPRAANSSSNTSPRPNRAFIIPYSMTSQSGWDSLRGQSLLKSRLIHSYLVD